MPPPQSCTKPNKKEKKKIKPNTHAREHREEEKEESLVGVEIVVFGRMDRPNREGSRRATGPNRHHRDRY